MRFLPCPSASRNLVFTQPGTNLLAELYRLTVRPRLEAAVIAHAPRPPQAARHPHALRRTAPALLAEVVVVIVREADDVGGGDAGGLLVAVVAERKVAGVRLDAARLRP